MAVVKTISELRRQLQKKLDSVLENEIAKTVGEKLHENIQERVYNRYSPSMYDRRGREGLGDPKNIVSELESFGVLAVKNTANPSPSVYGIPISSEDPTIFSRWINDGLVPNIFNTLHYVWEEPARFIEGTVDDLRSGNDLREAFKTGLAKRGIKNVR